MVNIICQSNIRSVPGFQEQMQRSRVQISVEAKNFFFILSSIFVLFQAQIINSSEYWLAGLFSNAYASVCAAVVFLLIKSSSKIARCLGRVGAVVTSATLQGAEIEHQKEEGKLVPALGCGNTHTHKHRQRQRERERERSRETDTHTHTHTHTHTLGYTLGLRYLLGHILEHTQHPSEVLLVADAATNSTYTHSSLHTHRIHTYTRTRTMDSGIDYWREKGEEGGQLFPLINRNIYIYIFFLDVYNFCCRSGSDLFYL